MDAIESSCVPPGFRFHPTDEELVGYYLKKKVGSERIDLDVIRDIDLYRIEPWDLQERCRIGYEQQNDWYFFSHKDKKYPTGTRTNRATMAGFWKATGRDKAVHDNTRLIGMRKTLVFYRGRAPHGEKTDWIIHEYRLETHLNAPPQEEGWVVCRAFKKRIPNINHMRPIESCFLNHHHHRLAPPPQYPSPNYACKEESELDQLCFLRANQFFDLPPLESSSTLLPLTSETEEEEEQVREVRSSAVTVGSEKVTDWRALDRFVASQLSPDEGFVGDTLEEFTSHEDPDMEEEEGNKVVEGLLTPEFDIGVFIFEN